MFIRLGVILHLVLDGWRPKKVEGRCTNVVPAAQIPLQGRGLRV